MVTAIVRKVQAKLQEYSRDDISVKLFSLCPPKLWRKTRFGVVWVAGGEGCSTCGGCATCPYMKMNTLDAMTDVIAKTGDRQGLSEFEPEKYAESLDGRTIAEVGGEPILFMRHFQKHGEMDPQLLELID